MAERIDDRLVADSARDLRGEAGLPFTERQLWYAVCSRLESPELSGSTAQVVVGTLLVLVAVVFGIWGSAIVALTAPVGMVIVGLGLQRRRAERNRPTTRPLAVSYDAFERDTVAALRSRLSEALEGMLPAQGEEPSPEAAAGAGSRPGSRRRDAMVVCDRGETAELVGALLRSAGLDDEVCVLDEPSLTQGCAGRRVLALHDADPRGCGLPLRLAAAGGQVVDAGLRPGQITDRRVPVIEGAPAVVAADLSALLAPDEVVWLARGRRVELATMPPRELLQGLRALLDAPAPPAAPGADGGAAVVAASLLLSPGPARPTDAPSWDQPGPA